MSLTTNSTDLIKCLDEAKRGIGDGSITGIFIVTTDSSGRRLHALSAAHLGFAEKLGAVVATAMMELLGLKGPTQ